jgi:pimeloyl-ACP methyl ester carboxylesterase
LHGLEAPLWDTVESGPTVAEHTVLLLPGGWCTAVFYRELMAEPALAGVRLVAATLPGHGGTPAPDDLSVQNYASLTAELAGRLGCTVVVGHSLGANVALEMVGSAAFTGPVLLLAPSFSRQDEAMVIRTMDRLAKVAGPLPYVALRSAMRFAFRGSPLPPERLAVLVAALRRNDPAFMRRGVHCYLRYLDQHGSVARRLALARAPAWVVHGQTGDGGMTAEERRILQIHPWIRIVTIRGRSVFTPIEEPALVAELVVAAIQATATQPTGTEAGESPD